jgi:glycosyltransferase involved in cell wall biosynthesis
VKILIDARTLGRRPSGVGMYLYNFICGLLQEKEIQMELVSDVAESTEIQKLKAAQLPLHLYGNTIEKSAGVYAYFHFVQKVIDEVKPDIFWEGNNLIPVVLKNPGGKIIVTVHDIFPVTAPDGYGRIYPYYFRWNLQKTLRHTDAVLYDSWYSKNSTETHFPYAKKVPSFLAYAIIEPVPELEVTDENYFLYIGNLEKRKGTDLLIEAYVKYRQAGGKKKLLLAGKIRSEEITGLLKKYQDVDGLCYQGYLSVEEKYKAYAGCSAFVFPSRAEGFGMPVIEALSYEKEVLVSELEIFRELVGDAVHYFSLSDRQQDAIDDLAAKMQQLDEGKTAPADAAIKREVVRKYQQKQVTGNLMRCLEQIMEKEEKGAGK